MVDFSEGGARLELDVPVGFPHRFKLVVHSPHIEALCETRHQGKDAIGVEFVTRIGSVPRSLLR